MRLNARLLARMSFRLDSAGRAMSHRLASQRGNAGSFFATAVFFNCT